MKYAAPFFNLKIVIISEDLYSTITYFSSFSKDEHLHNLTVFFLFISFPTHAQNTEK